MKGSYEFPESNANFETSTAEWEFVERLYPMKYIPKPNFEPGEIAPSGWRAPKAKKDDYPYFVTRDRSHMFRLYRDFDPITQILKTKLKGIEGDVFALGEELKKYLLLPSGKRMIDLRVYEPFGIIIIRGDLKMLVLDFLHEKGF
ncbi:39S ribosomal protein L49, mitochondrial [Armadillidium nasatum]|uniref:Large ribosomal subunit protein mL49 n=1 Tax=Armadillidium nasatum TaxID=96803 RepID=A0A5N5SL63_9CRUS|nr:39S ribosomal protein L49, mitochondrial [Armadillidium nasatum]